MIYSWHQQQWQQITEHWQNQPNAWLFTGKANTGKTAFARYLAQALLCESSHQKHEPCGECSSCHLFHQNSHPDFYELTPEIAEGEMAGRKLLQIKIDAVRSILENVHLSSVRGGRRVVLIQPVESMNVQAANALLKVLEEPPQDVVFLLVTHARDKLLPTIKSRCRQLVLLAPKSAEALHYLEQKNIDDAASLLAFHSGAPLFDSNFELDGVREELLSLLSSPRLLAVLDYAVIFDKQKQPLAIFIDWLQKWLIDIGLAQQHMLPLYYPHHTETLKHIALKTQASTLFRLIDNLNTISPYGNHTLSVRIQIESILIDYLQFWQNK